MKNVWLFLLFIAPLYCFGGKGNAPTMVQWPNGPTCTMLEVGTTSIIFSVEWPVNFDFDWMFNLRAKDSPEWEHWHCLQHLSPYPANQTGLFGRTDALFPIKGGFPERKAVYEILYGDLPAYYGKDDERPPNPVYSVEYEHEIEGKYWRGMYWESDSELCGGTMVQHPNGPVCTMLEVGTTSITFAVEWPLDVDPFRKEPPFQTFSLVGKHFPKWGWSFLHELNANLAHRVGARAGEKWYSYFPIKVDAGKRKAVFEVLYKATQWYHMSDRDYPDLDDISYPTNTVYSVIYSVPGREGRRLFLESFEEENARSGEALGAGVEKNEDASPLRVDKPLAEQGEADSSPNRLWIFLAFLPVIFAIFYFVRRSMKT